MRLPAGNWFVVVIAGSLLVACADKNIRPQDLDPNIQPVNYKQEMLDGLKRTIDDPTNVRDAFISPPVLTQVGNDQRYTACVRYNSREENRYVGNRERIAFFYGGHLNQLVEPSAGQCSKAAYQPFPELEHLCLAAKCN
jgi:hypothetical protein